MDNYYSISSIAPATEGLICPIKRLRTDVVIRLQSAVKRADLENGCTDENSFSSLFVPPESDYATLTNMREPRLIDLVNGYTVTTAGRGCEWISDLLRFERWKKGDIVLIDAVCSAGKNTYIEELLRYGVYDRILIFANRRGNRDQIVKRTGFEPGKVFQHVEVMTYQAFEQRFDMPDDYLEGFDLIVADECHYFTTDSLFSSSTILSFERIMNAKRPVKLFMSATPEDFFRVVIRKLKKYYRPEVMANFCHLYRLKVNKQVIRSVSYVDLFEIMEKAKNSSEKWLIFVDSKDDGQMLKKGLGDDAVFMTAESSVSEPEAIEQYANLVEKEYFTCRILIATSVVDNGINIRDRRLRHIVLSSNSRVELVQMLGRKRCIDRNDEFQLYIIHTREEDMEAAMGMWYKEKKQWENARMFLEQEGFPTCNYSQETEEGKRARAKICQDNRIKKFRFNYLGYEAFMVRGADLRELANSTDPFQVKLDWLFKGIEQPHISFGYADYINRKIHTILDSVKDYKEKTFEVKDGAFTEFREAFSQAFWKAYGVDTAEYQRKDRILSASKINDACKKKGIPLELIRSRKKDKTTYTIK